MNIPTLDPEMKTYIVDCGMIGLNAAQILRKLHDDGFEWVKFRDVLHVLNGIDDRKSLER